jgi:NADPH-dependent 2,4-dienoyl-CoA reductase/sulfur reductase-like enzyme/rhodanese-related sulfurtransferase
VSDTSRDVVVVGGSAAGMRCACRLTRLKPEWRVRVVEARPVFSYGACGLPYVLSGDIPDREELRRTDYGLSRDEEYFRGHKGVEVLAGHRATSIDVPRRLLRVEGPDGRTDLPWDELVLASGAKPMRLPNQPDHPRVATFHVWDDVKPLKQGLARRELDRVAVVGAGLIGCELAEAFRSLWGAEVSLIESAAAPLPGILDADLGFCVAEHMKANGVELTMNAPVESIEPAEHSVTIHAGGAAIEAQAVVVAVGVEPVVGIAREAGVELGPRGAIAVDERLATSIPHIWAAGDCVEVRHAVTGETTYAPLGSLANRQGRTLANVLAGRPDAFPAVAGSVAVKVFDWNVAAVGCTTALARQHGIPVRSAWCSAHDRASYWPESKEIHLKLSYDPRSRRLLGLQVAGEGEAAKRVDAATPLIVRGATLEELAHIEHAYAPPYSPALDPLAVAAFAAQNQEDGIEAFPPFDSLAGATVLDVRLADEAEARPAGAERGTQIPLGELRDRLDEVDASTNVVVCERGTRSAEAVRLLRGRGLRARYLGGGIRWRKR